MFNLRIITPYTILVTRDRRCGPVKSMKDYISLEGVFYMTQKQLTQEETAKLQKEVAETTEKLVKEILTDYPELKEVKGNLAFADDLIANIHFFLGIAEGESDYENAPELVRIQLLEMFSRIVKFSTFEDLKLIVKTFEAILEFDVPEAYPAVKFSFHEGKFGELVAQKFLHLSDAKHEDCECDKSVSTVLAPLEKLMQYTMNEKYPLEEVTFKATYRKK